MTLWTVISGIGVLLIGSGLLGTSVGLRAIMEGFGHSTVGLIMGCYFLGFLAGTWLCPPLIARVGHIRTFAALAATVAAIAVIHHLWVGPELWAFLRFINGVGLVGIYMVVESWLNSEASPAARGRIFSVYVTVVWLALGGGQALLLLDAKGGELAFGLVTILFCAGLVPVALTDVAEPERVPAPRFRPTVLRAIPPLGVAGSLVAGLVAGGFWGLGAVFAHTLGIRGNALAAFMMAPIAGSVLSHIPVGRLSDRLDRRSVVAATCMAGAVFALAMLVTGDRVISATIGFALAFGATAFPLYALSVAHVNDRLERRDSLEATRAVLMLYGIGAAAGPMAAGFLMGTTGGWMLPIYFAVPLVALASFALWRRRIQPPVPVEEKAAFAPLSTTSHVAIPPAVQK